MIQDEDEKLKKGIDSVYNQNNGFENKEDKY